MATTTPNFGWPVPTSTDLVKDGATAIEALGDSIDASLLDLKGGTSGQVLAKNSNTDMDFVWVTDAAGDITGVTAGTGISGGGTSGTVTVTNSMATAIDAKGDLVAGTGADTFARLAVGANGTVLTADSAEATGLKWATAASGGITLITSTDMAGVADVTFSSITGTYKNLYILIKNYYQAADAGMKIEINGNTTSNNYEYTITSGRSSGSLTTYSNTNFLQDLTTEGADADNFMYLFFPDYTNTIARKQIQNSAGYLSDNGSVVTQFGTHQFRSTSAITSIRIFSSSAGNFTAGTCQLYGVN
jgi:hypothetical protein